MMKSKTSVFTITLVAITMALTGCGGGGGSAAPATGGGGTGTPSTSGGGVIGGVAGKGLLKNASVTAYCGKQSENVSIGTDTTGDGTGSKAAGSYSITMTQSCSQPVEIVVTASSSTTMDDEVQGTISAPADLKLRAFVSTVSSSSNITKHITPFTDMAAAVTEAATSLTANAVSNAETAIVQTVLGGNAAVFNAQPQPLSTYNSTTIKPEEKQLLTLLTAVSSAAAANSVTGCTGGNVQCVLTDLANKAKQTVTAVSDSGYSVATTADPTTNTPVKTIADGINALATVTVSSSSALSGIKETVASDAAAMNIAGLLKAAKTETTVLASSNGGAVTVKNTSTIATAKNLFTVLRNNLLSIANDSNSGFLQTKASAMDADFQSVHRSSYNLPMTFTAMEKATKFVTEVARGNVNSSNAYRGSLIGDHTVSVSGDYWERVWDVNLATGTLTASSLVCNYYISDGTGLTTTTPTRSGANQGNAVCVYFPDFPDQRTHVVFMANSADATKTGTSATYNYKTWVRTFASASCTNYFDASCAVTEGSAQTGSYQASWDATTGDFTSITLTNGKLLPLVQGDSHTLANLSLSTKTSSQPEPINVSGSLASISSGGTTSLSIALEAGSNTIFNAATGAVKSEFIGQIKTSAFQYDGTLNLSGNDSALSSVSSVSSFGGIISTLSNGTATAFLSGAISAQIPEVADQSKPISATNFTRGTVSASAKVINGSDVSQLTMVFDQVTYGQTGSSITYSFGGSYSLTMTGTIADTAATPDSLTISASDGTTVTLTKTKTASGSSTTGVVKDSSGNQIGTINSSNKQVDFTDGTYLALL